MDPQQLTNPPETAPASQPSAPKQQQAPARQLKPSRPVAPPPHNNRPTLIAAIIIVGLFLIGGAIAWWTTHQAKPAKSAVTPAQSGVLRVGTIIDENGLAADKAEFQPFIDYLVGQLHDQGITKGQFVAETSVSNMAKLLREGKVDLYIDSIFPVFVADRLSGSSLIADRWKEGVEKYHTAIFVPKASPIKSVADLKGKLIAFDSSTSTVGYFLPKAELTKLGYKLTQKQKTTDTVASDEIGYVFVHDKVFDSVQDAVTPAGAESEQEIRDHFGATFDQQYRVVMTTPDVLRFAVTGRSDLSLKLRTAIKATLLSMDQAAAGKQALKDFSDTAKFTDVGTDSDTAYGEIQKLTDLVEQEIVQGGAGASK